MSSTNNTPITFAKDSETLIVIKGGATRPHEQSQGYTGTGVSLFYGCGLRVNLFMQI